MGKKELVFNEVAKLMALYFIYGRTENYKSYLNELNKNLKQKEYDQFPEYFQEECDRMDDPSFESVAKAIFDHRRRLGNSDFEKEVRICESILKDTYTIK